MYAFFLPTVYYWRQKNFKTKFWHIKLSFLSSCNFKSYSETYGQKTSENVEEGL